MQRLVAVLYHPIAATGEFVESHITRAALMFKRIVCKMASSSDYTTYVLQSWACAD
jgi:hypothetical protein